MSKQAKISDTEFHKRVENFRAGNSTVDYIVRCWTVSDEEEFQVGDYKDNTLEFELFDHCIVDLRRTLPANVVDKIVQLLKKKGTDAPILELLLPYISNRDLYESNNNLWEDLFFADDGLTKEDFDASQEHLYSEDSDGSTQRTTVGSSEDQSIR